MNASGSSGSEAAAVSGGIVCSIDAAQQAHVHRTQNAGQPLSGADSVAPIGQLSGTISELTPLASPMSTASTAMNNTRRIALNIAPEPHGTLSGGNAHIVRRGFGLVDAYRVRTRRAFADVRAAVRGCMRRILGLRVPCRRMAVRD